MPKKKSALHAHRFGNQQKRREHIVSNQPEMSSKQRHRERTVDEKLERKEYFEKLVRVGPKRPPLMGKRTIVEKHHTDYTKEFMDFITDAPFAGGKYRLFVTGQWFNRSIVVLLWRQFYDRNIMFWPLEQFPNSIFISASMLIKKYFFGPVIDVRKKNTTLLQVRQKCVQFLGSMDWCRKMIKVFGYAFLPQHTITHNGQTTAVHNVPRSHVQPSMVAFLNGNNGEFTGLDDVIEPRVRFYASKALDFMAYPILSSLDELNTINNYEDIFMIVLVLMFVVLSPTVLYAEALLVLTGEVGATKELILSKLSRVLYKYLKIDLVLDVAILDRIKDNSIVSLDLLKTLINFCYANGAVLVTDIKVRMKVFLARHVTNRQHDDNLVIWFLSLFSCKKRRIEDLRGGMDRAVRNPLQAVNQANQGLVGVIGDRPARRRDRPHPNDGQDRAAPFGDWYRNKDRCKTEFLHIAIPEHRTLWTLEEMRLHTPVLIDCMGSPFCGMTAIDIACKILPKVDTYCHCLRFKRDVSEGGRISFLKQWASWRGVNLRVSVPISGGQTRTFDYEANPIFEWAHLTLKNSDGTNYTEAEWADDDHIGHFWLNVRVIGDVPNVGLPELGDGCFYQLVKMRLLTALFLMMLTVYVAGLIFNLLVHYDDLWYYTAAVWGAGTMLLTYSFMRIFSWNVVYSTEPCFNEHLGYFRNADNRDIRSLRDRRDKFEHQDYYLRAVRVFSLHFLKFRIYQTDSRVYVISVGRANQAIKECQLLPDGEEEKCLASVMRASVCNTNDSENGIYLDTIQYVKDWIACRQDRSGAGYDKRIVAYNASGMSSYIPNIGVLAVNQVAGRLMGQGVNHVKKLNNPTEKDLIRKVVAYCPDSSCLQTSRGPMGPGNLCVSDSFSILAAFTGRSMSGEAVSLDYDLLDEFVSFSKKFLMPFIDHTDVSEVVEDEDPCNYFREMYKGKKPSSYIDSVLEMYSNWLKKFTVPRKFFQFGSFVKFEDSTKVVDGVARVRPRLIMTMSDYMLVKSCQFMKVVKAWCHGPFSQFQVKNLEPEEFIHVIEKASDKHHIVTDYSAFESSINGVVREIENFVFEQLMVRAGFTYTLYCWRAINTIWFNKIGNANFRTLQSKCGSFKIWSRCSGDFHTSAGNGIINVCVNAFACYKRLGFLPSDFQMIAEGDDGLIQPRFTDAEQIQRLGFKFSSELEGFVAGDVDFLRRRWLMGTCFLNIGRSLKNTMWVKSQVTLGRAKILAIWRAMGLSLHYMSPGHPVLFELVNRIGRLTRECSVPFTGIERYFNTYQLINQPYNIFDFGSYPRDVKCNEFMRQYIADGAQGFPPLSISIQLELEKRLRKDEVVYIGSLLDDYDDVKGADLCDQWLHGDRVKMSEEFKTVVNILGRTGVQTMGYEMIRY